jgi:hypothetical protein
MTTIRKSTVIKDAFDSALRASVPDTNTMADATKIVRDVLSDQRNCWMPCACLENPQGDDCGSDAAEIVKALGAIPVRASPMGDVERLRAGIAAIKLATIEGRVCDDVAWFDEITTLHDFCDYLLRPQDTDQPTLTYAPRRVPETEDEANEAADNGRNTGGRSYR